MAHRLTHRSLLGVVVPVAVAASVGAAAVHLLAAHAPEPSMTRSSADLAVVSLTDDASGALFRDADLLPGRTVRRCLQVRFAGAGADAEVRLVAEDLTGPLLPYLHATVAVGTGGGYAGCGGFAGTTVYDGPIGGLGGGPGGAPGIGTGWQPTGAGSRTFAITVRVADDNAAQAKSAGATLRWALMGPDSVPSSPAATPSSPQPADPLPAASPQSPSAQSPSPQPAAAAPAAARNVQTSSPAPVTPAPARPGSPSRTVVPSAEAPAPQVADRPVVAKLVLAAFHGGVAAVQWVVAGQGRRLAVPVIVMVLIVLVSAARWVRRRRRAARS